MTAIRDLSNSLGVTPETFNTLIVGVIIVGCLWAVVRLYQDFTRPLPAEPSTPPDPETKAP
jgi:hypothetical protein